MRHFEIFNIAFSSFYLYVCVRFISCYHRIESSKLAGWCFCDNGDWAPSFLFSFNTTVVSLPTTPSLPPSLPFSVKSNPQLKTQGEYCPPSCMQNNCFNPSNGTFTCKPAPSSSNPTYTLPSLTRDTLYFFITLRAKIFLKFIFLFQIIFQKFSLNEKASSMIE